MKLIFPEEAWAEEISAYRREFLDAGDSMDGTGILRRTEDPLAWIEGCRRLRQGQTPDGWVPSTQFMYVNEETGKIVGMIDVRHRLNAFLEQYGGHIGYSVRPCERGRGLAAEMLREALRCAFGELKLPRVLITCGQANEASRRTILRCGGVYESTAFEPMEKMEIQRYWIENPEKSE